MNQEAEGKVIFHTDIARNAVRKWGKAAQIDMAIEEMSELTKALLKDRRAERNPAAWDCEKVRENVAEEMADVYIMLLQLEIIFQNSDETRRIRSDKMNRLYKRIQESGGRGNVRDCKQ